tara:strand:- start:297 stop:554 length:258 start_codon:yes stop_codon:yes gene_type:complete
MKTEYSRVSEIVKIFDGYWIPFDVVCLEAGGNNVSIDKLTDKKSGAVYLERFDPSVNSYSVYKFDKFNIPQEWQIEEDSDVTVKV